MRLPCRWGRWMESIRRQGSAKRTHPTDPKRPKKTQKTPKFKILKNSQKRKCFFFLTAAPIVVPRCITFFSFSRQGRGEDRMVRVCDPRTWEGWSCSFSVAEWKSNTESSLLDHKSTQEIKNEPPLAVGIGPPKGLPNRLQRGIWSDENQIVCPLRWKSSNHTSPDFTAE